MSSSQKISSWYWSHIIECSSGVLLTQLKPWSHLIVSIMCLCYIIIFPRNVSFRGYYVFDSNAAAAAAASSHHFVVSAITFEGFKLRSSNLTHALFIQISRTSSITDIVVQSKMAAGGHFVQKFQKKKKLRIDLKWQEL